MDGDSLQGVTIESAGFDFPASSSSPGQGPPSSASNVGLLGKIKLKVGLNKKKDSKVIVSNATDGINIDHDNVSDIDNGKVHSSNAKTSISNGMSNSSGNNNVSNISDNAKTSTSNGMSNSEMTIVSNNVAVDVSSQNLSESEYIGQGVLAGRENNSDMELEVESQKRSHPDSDSVDSVDDNSFVMPVPPPRSSRKKPAVVVSPGTARPVAVEHDRDHSRS